MNIVKGYYYSKDHEWIKVDGEKAYIGITDYAQHALGDIVYVELPEVDDELEAGDSFGVLESVKAAADIYIPISGTVVEVNEALEDEPELLNSEPYDQFIMAINAFDKSDLNELMDDEAYKKYCEDLD